MDYNTKISEIEGKIHSITDLDTTAALTAVKNKIPLVSSLVKKKDHDTKLSDIERRYFTTSEYKKFTHDMRDEKIKENRLVNETAIAGFLNSVDLNRKVGTLATKAESKLEEDKIVKHLIQVIFAAKVILKMMTHKII